MTTDDLTSILSELDRLAQEISEINDRPVEMGMVGDLPRVEEAFLQNNEEMET